MTAIFVLLGLSILLLATAVRQGARNRARRRAAAAIHLNLLRSKLEESTARPRVSPVIGRAPDDALELSNADYLVNETEACSTNTIAGPAVYKPCPVTPYGGLTGLGPVGRLGEFAPDAPINGAKPGSDNLYGA